MHLVRLFLLFSVLGVLASCGGIDSTDSLELSSVELNTLQVDGVASGTLTAFDFSEGKKGNELARATFSEGGPSLDLEGFSGHLLVELTDAVYLDPILERNVSFRDGDVWQALIPDFASGRTLFNVNFWTTLATRYAFYLIDTNNVSARQAILTAKTEVSRHLLGVDILDTERVPLALASSATLGAIYELSLVAVSQSAIANGLGSLLELGEHVFLDIQDGLIDGKFGVTELEVNGNFLGSALLTVALAQAVQDIFANNLVDAPNLSITAFEGLIGEFADPNSVIFSSLPTFSGDLDGPQITVQGIASGDLVSGPITIRAEAIDVGSGVLSVSITLNDAPVTDTDPTANVFESTIVAAEGSNTLSFKATDFAGNETVTTITFAGDNVPPVNTITWNGDNLASGQHVGGVGALRVIAADTNDITFLEVETDSTAINTSLNDANPHPQIYEADIDVLTHLETIDTLRITVRSGDEAGNENEKVFDLNVDNTGPVIDFISPGEDLTVSGVANVVLSMSSHFGIPTASVRVYNAIQSQDLFDSDSTDGLENYTAAFDTTTLVVDGAAKLEVIATDGAGITKQADFNFAINNVIFGEVVNFQTTKGIAHFETAFSVKAGDFNGDGHVDVMSMGDKDFTGFDHYPLFSYQGPAFNTRSADWTLLQLPLVPPNSQPSEWNFLVDAASQDQEITVCDLNGDGKDDIAAGRPFYDNFLISGGKNKIGAVSLHYGSQNLLSGIWDTLLILENPGATGQWESFGFISSCADFNKDGKGDLLIGGRTILSNPASWIFYGHANPSTGLAGVKLGFPQGGTYWTLFPIAIGDFDGDGFEDFIGQDADPDKMRIYYGPWVLGTEPNASNTSPKFDVEGEINLTQTNIDNGFANRFYKLGDIDDDGFADFAVARSQSNYKIGNTTYSRVGVVTVLFGNSNRSQPKAKTVVLTYPDAAGVKDDLAFANRGIAGGDFNGDGFDDIAIASSNADVAGNTTSGSVSVFYGPTVSSGEVIDEIVPIAGAICGRSVFVTDTNKDGRDDIITNCGGFAHENIYIIRDNQ